MKYLLLVAVLLAGCEMHPTAAPADKPVADAFTSISGFEDCKLVDLTDNHGHTIYVARCPNSTTSTTTHAGKQLNHAIIYD